VIDLTGPLCRAFSLPSVSCDQIAITPGKTNGKSGS
jgi:hypothetical protein